MATADNPIREPGVAADKRLVTLDFLRGVAVLGILLMNIAGFAWPEVALLSPRAPHGPRGPADEALFLAEFVLVDGKLRGLFSLLFGASMLLLVTRADAGGGDGLRLQQRRLLWLALFGLAHFYLLWWGDILFLYALCGLFALSFVDWPARRLLALALPLYAVGALWLGALTVGEAAPWLGGSEAAQAAASATAERRASVAARSDYQAHLASWPDKVTHEFVAKWDRPFTGVTTAALETLPLMLVGMALLRLGLLAGAWPPARVRRLAAGGIVLGLAPGVPLAWWLAASGFPLPLVPLVSLSLAAPLRLAATVGYAALLVLVARRYHATAGGHRIVAAGRMALSNYLGTSLVMAGLFHGWGLGLYGRFSRVELLGFVALGWLLMLAWSKPWLERYRHGPVEWLWRCLVQGRVQPLSRLANATKSH